MKLMIEHNGEVFQVLDENLEDFDMSKTSAMAYIIGSLSNEIDRIKKHEN